MNRNGLTGYAMLAAILTAALGVLPAAAQPLAFGAEGGFMAQNDTAMSTMMSAMSIKPTGNIDRDFALMMIAHHQGAIDMAQAELRYGRTAQLRRIAQEIVVTQLDEITAMQLAIQVPPHPRAGLAAP